jgi:hypothetical protein
LICTVALALAPQLCLAQQLAVNAPLDARGEATASSETILAPMATIHPAAPATEKPLLGRWLDLETFSHSERYRNAFAAGGFHDFENAQQRSLLVGRLKLDAEGRYEVGFRASSGRYFNWAYGGYTGMSFIPRVLAPGVIASYETPAQYREAVQASFADPAGFTTVTANLKSNGMEFYLRELFFSGTPVKAVTVEFGSFGIERGYSTEITSFDEDGYLSGERVRFRDAKHLFFDEVGFTNAYFGDIDTVNLFDRGGSLKKSNYRQAFAKKRLNARIAFSGEYTWQTGTDTLREAFVVKTPELKAVDGVRFEAYERLNGVTFAGLANSPLGPIAPLTVNGASGFAAVVEKKLGNLSGDAGFATVDSDYAVYANSRFIHAVGFALNGDTYGQGNRLFTHVSYRIAPGVTAFGFFTHEVGATRVLTLNQQGFNAGVTFDMKAMVNKTKLVF